MLPRTEPPKRASKGPTGDRDGPHAALWRAWRTEKESPALLRQILEACGLQPGPVQINQLWQYYLRIRERNQEINITRIRRFPEVVVKHYADCALVGTLTELPGPLMDLGSGGGFPGVPLKILHPEVPIVLAEGRRLRVEFLEEVRRSLRLPQLYIYGHQVHPQTVEPARAVVTRAVERIRATLERIDGCLCRGGRAIFMKGPSVDPEIRETETRLAGRYRLLEDHAYELPATDHKRRLVVFERLDGTPYEEMPPGLAGGGAAE
jgi:16S rRNA (guanine(527)-N(7))-methyltransferase RsmG